MDESLTEWLGREEEGCTAIHLPHIAIENNFVFGDPSGERLNVEYYRRADELLAKVIFGPATQGPPGHAHGGSMFSVLDETMGSVAWMLGHMVVALEVTTRFKSMLPLSTPCVAVAEVTRVEGRKVWTRGSLRDDGGEVLYAEAEGLFLELPAEKFGELAKQNLFVPKR